MTFSIQMRRTTATGLAAALGALGLTVGGFAAAGATASAAPGRAVAAGPTTTVGGPTTGPTGTGPVTGTTVSASGTPSASTPCPTAATGTPPPTPTAVRTWDFEDGTVQGWYGSSGVTLGATTDAAASGTHALAAHQLASGGWFQTSTNALPYRGWYSVTALVRLPAGTPQVSIGLRLPNAEQAVPGRAMVESTGWTRITAWFRPTTVIADWICNGTMTGGAYAAGVTVQLAIDYPGCVSPPPFAPPTVYVDDVTITSTTSGVTPPPGVTPAPTTSGCGTTTPPPATCRASYKIINQWAGGYVASIDVRDTGGSPRPTWKISWTFPTDQTVVNLWGGTVSQSGRAVTVTSPSWAPLPANGTVNVGFVGSTASTPVAPATVSLDGAVCAAL